MSLDVAEGQIQGVSSIINPDKLRHLGPLADLGALLRERSQILQLAGSSWIVERCGSGLALQHPGSARPRGRLSHGPRQRRHARAFALSQCKT
jgi:hypothetical protein